MATRLLVLAVPGPTMPTLTPVSQVGPIRHDTFMWDRQKAVSELESPEPEVAAKTARRSRERIRRWPERPPGVR
jgi:hypothetical protein